MGEDEDQLAALIAFLRHELREDRLPITRETSLEDDLGVTGDDAHDLILAFGKQFNVVVDNFKIGDYFGDEPAPFWPATRKLKPFTVAHLEKAIRAGRLDDSVL